ncbi:MAG: STAS domain-containing protein [Oligoflexia bacterium]|nr:STAS domain-containing protein [Oligoflexia bacterium]
MPINVNEKAGVYVIDMEGELGFSELEKVSRALAGIHKAPKNSVLNMEKLVFLSSLVIRDIVELWKKLKASGNPLLIIGMNQTIFEIFKTTGLTSVLDIEDVDLEQAIERVRS